LSAGWRTAHRLELLERVTMSAFVAPATPVALERQQPWANESVQRGPMK